MIIHILLKKRPVVVVRWQQDNNRKDVREGKEGTCDRVSRGR